jgi:DNA modification methylase
MIRKELEHLAINIDEIHTHPSNVRQGDVGAICESLKAHGQYRAIVFQKSTGRILAGNHTWKAAKALGWTEIAATPVVCDDQQALRILLADNKANDLATYDEPELVELLKQLADTDEGLLGTLFDEDELDSLIADQSHFELPSDVDDVPDHVPAVSKLGDVWLLGDHRVMCGDSTNQSSVLTLVNNQVINAVFTDPPYGINIEGDRSKRGGLAQGGKFKNFKDDSTVYAEKAFDIVKTLDVPIQIWFGANYYAHHLPQSNNWLVWDKRLEDIQRDTPSDCELAWVKSRFNSVRIFRHLWKGMIKGSENGERRVHPTQKPIALPVWCFNEYEFGTNVLDLFGGSGSTLIAAQETNRVAYLMELDPHYVDVICARYQKHTGNQPVLEATGEAHDFTPDAD